MHPRTALISQSMLVACHLGPDDQLDPAHITRLYQMTFTLAYAGYQLELMLLAGAALATLMCRCPCGRRWYTQQNKPWGARSIPLVLNVIAVIQALLFILCMFGSNWQVRPTSKVNRIV